MINENPAGYHYMNHLGIVLNSNKNQGIGDSLGRTADAAMIFRQKKLIDGTKSFFINAHTSSEQGTQIYVTRYPGELKWAYLRGNSRDHVQKAITALTILKEHEFVNNFIRHKARRPSINRGYTPGQKIWFKAIKSKAWSWVYFLYMLPGTGIIPIYNFTLRLISRTLKTYKDPSDHYSNKSEPTKWQKKCFKSTIKTFASYYTAFGLHAIKAKIPAKILGFLMRVQFEKTNYVAQAICGKKIKVKNYIPSRKNRWTLRLDDTCDRNTKPHNDTAENNMELALLKYHNEFA